MYTIRRSKAQMLLLLCSLGGVGIAIYLTAVHYENVPLVCSDSGLVDCARVLSSPFSVVPGTSIPITVPGMVSTERSPGDLGLVSRDGAALDSVSTIYLGAGWYADRPLPGLC